MEFNSINNQGSKYMTKCHETAVEVARLTGQDITQVLNEAGEMSRISVLSLQSCLNLLLNKARKPNEPVNL